MSLGLTLNSALSGLRVNQEGLRVLTNNITNASTPNYSRQEMELAPRIVNNIGVGVEVQEIARKADAFLTEEIRRQLSQVDQSKTLKDFYERIQLLYGKPDAQDSLNGYLNNFFGALDAFTNAPEQSYTRSSAVQKANELTLRISGLAKDLHQIRFEADKEIKNTVDTLTNELATLRSVNLSIADATRLKQSTASLFDKRDAALRKITEILNVQITNNSDGQVYVSTPDGKGLLNDSTFKVTYIPAKSVDTFMSDFALNEVKVERMDQLGNPSGSIEKLVTGGVSGSSAITSTVESGKIKALLNLRDVEIPKLLDQLDMLASTLRDQMNATHNDGAGFPPPNSLTGTRLLTPTEQHQWGGNVRISVVDKNGKAIPAPYNQVISPLTDETKVRPLTINLASIEAGGGAGKPDVNALMNEINSYFGPPQNRIVAGRFGDIRMASVSNTFGPPWQFDFELDNASAAGANFRVTGVSSAAGVTFGAIPAGLSGAPGYATTAGSLGRTGPTNSITADFSAGVGGPIFTVNVNVEVDGVAGTLSYRVDTSAANVRNVRYAGFTAGGVAQISVPTSNQRYAKAELVDANGATVSGATAGYLKIYTQNSTYGIVIDEMTSQEQGIPGQANTATNRGFSHYYELNNLFVSNKLTSSNAYTVKHSALNMALRKEVLDKPSILSAGELTQSLQPADPSKPPLYTYELGIGGNQVAKRLADFRTKRLDFVSAGGLPTITLSAGNYSAEVTSYISLKTVDAQRNHDQQKTLNDNLKAKSDSISGVNIDEEMANTIALQNAYAASARVINAVKELFDILLKIGE